MSRPLRIEYPGAYYHVMNQALAGQAAMYLTRELCNLTLKEIAEIFSLGSYGSIGVVCGAIDAKLKLDRTLL